MRGKAVLGSATVVSARRHERRGGGGPEDGESYWWQDVGESAFGSTDWDVELDVQGPDGATYQLQDTVAIPNRLQGMTKLLDRPPRLYAGLVLPVLISTKDHGRVEVDWKAFKAAGGVELLFDRDPGIVASVKATVADIRSESSTADPPASPRPTAESHPPIDGVDYETWIRANVGFVQEKIKAGQYTTYLQTHGVADGSNAAWFDRSKADETVGAWYVYDSANLDLG